MRQVTGFALALMLVVFAGATVSETADAQILPIKKQCKEDGDCDGNFSILSCPSNPASAYRCKKCEKGTAEVKRCWGIVIEEDCDQDSNPVEHCGKEFQARCVPKQGGGYKCGAYSTVKTPQGGDRLCPPYLNCTQ
jgi:hypothetical protein